MIPIKLLKFGSSWCNPCKLEDKEMDKLKDCIVIHYDVEEDEKVVEQYKVRGVPAMILLVEDIERKRWSGFTKANIIQLEIDKYVIVERDR